MKLSLYSVTHSGAHGCNLFEQLANTALLHGKCYDIDKIVLFFNIFTYTALYC